MRGNPDPKPGRWILPLVILGMVGFTYMVVNSIEPASPEEASGDTTTTLGSPVEETTTTTLDPNLQAYVDALDGFASESQSLEDQAVAINQRWDDDEQDFQTTLDQLREHRDQAQAFRDSVETRTPPAGAEDLAAAHTELIALADRILAGAEAMITGLQAPDTGQQRRAALEEYRQAAADFRAQVAETRALVTGEPAEEAPPEDGEGEETTTTEG